MSSKTADSWKERLPEIIHGCKPEGVWNMDESGCFWKPLPDKGFAQKGKACHDGKSSKVRLMVAFFVNASGDKEKAVVIWKFAKPRCFKGIITYLSNTLINRRHGCQEISCISFFLS